MRMLPLPLSPDPMRRWLPLLLPFVAVATAQSWQPLRTDSGFAEDVRGVWRSQGYGWALDLRADTAVLYDAGPAGCLPADPSLLDDLRVFARAGDTLRLASQPENATRYRFVALTDLPAACAAPPAATPRAVFDYVWGVMDADYASFDVFGVDWDARYAALAPTVHDGMTDAALFDTLVALFEGLRDAHLSIQSEEHRFSGYPAPTFGAALQAAFDAQEREETRSAFGRAWMRTDRARLASDLLGGQVKTAADGRVEWGQAGCVGYLALSSMGGFSEGALTAEIDSAHAVMNRALADLADTDALIVDVALNPGGYDAVALAFAAHFAAEPTFVLTKHAHGAEAETKQAFRVLPAAPRYAKPVYVLTSDVTVSAAEVFILAMRAFPQVTHAGAPTRGSLSDQLARPLPNGWTLTLSNEVYLDRNGVAWEGRGIPPDVPLPMFAAGLDGHAAAIRALVDRLSPACP